MTHNIIRTVIPPRWYSARDISENEQYKPWLLEPPPLVELAGDVVNAVPMPDCWEWDVDDITKWLRNVIGLPQYKECFEKNHINGRRLLRVDASVCPRIGIHDFSHIQRITAGIRKLFMVELPEFNRSISLPPRYPLTHYLLYRIPPGPLRANTTRVQLFGAMGILDEEKAFIGHWEMIDPTQPDFPVNRFGLVKRKNVYARVENRRQPRCHAHLKRSEFKVNYFYRIDVR